ncbi:MAG: hypothetical protein ABRQ39_13110 [Candidatus Eremiobacterota bacterium]
MEEKIVNFIKEHRKYAILISLLIISILLNNYTILSFTGIKVKDEKEEIRDIVFPFREDSTRNRVYIFTGKIYSSHLSQRVINIVADDRIEYIRINNNPVSLDKMITKSFSGYINGFDIDIGSYIHAGENRFELKLIDDGGTVALDISNSSRDKLYISIHIIMLILLSILLYYFFNYFRFIRRSLFPFWKQMY